MNTLEVAQIDRQGPLRARIDTNDGAKSAGGAPQRLDLNAMGDALRTEQQLKPYEGFRPEEHHVRQESLTTSSRGTMLLAKPPAYTETPGLACIPDPELGPEAARAHMDQWDTPSKKKAQALCSGCPVIEQCLSDALERERHLDRWSRYLVRGGKVPSERADMVFGQRKVYLKECDHCDWVGEKPSQHLRRKHPELAA